MTTLVLYVSLLLVILQLTEGQSTTSEDSHCSYTFKVPTANCGQTPGEVDLLKSSVLGLQAQVKLLTRKIADMEAGIDGRSVRSAVNLKQCSTRGMNEGKEHGVVWSCPFVKKRDDSVLRIVWNGDLRFRQTVSSGGSCRRWFFTINGLECSEPKTIDTQFYINTNTVDMHRPAYVEGYCRGIAAGQVNVVWNVGDCPNQGSYHAGDSYSGWIATVRIIVEEVDVIDTPTTIV